MVLTATVIAAATGGQLVAGDPGHVIDGFAIDSRTLQPGDLFFAIVAARDGHAFVGDALARGASGAVVQTGAPGATGEAPAADRAADAGHARTDDRARRAAVRIEVEDTTRALQALGRHVRRASGATMVAITGSAGKTTTKEAIATLLGDAGRVVCNRGNLNNHLGLPLSLLELRHGADIAVMELGMNHAGEIRLLVSLAEPEIRVWINVGDAHLGQFPSVDALADAKAEILEGATAADVLVCNADDPRIGARVAGFPGRTITFGASPDADVRGEVLEDRGMEGAAIRVHTPVGAVSADVPLAGRGHLSNVLAAVAVAVELGVPLPECAARCRGLRPAPHRGVVLKLASGVTVLDDSYNSSPAALRTALDLLSRASGARRKAAVLGEMLELGDHALALHRESGRLAAGAGLDCLVTVGGAPAQAMAEAAVEHGMPAAHVTWAPHSAAASDLITSWIASGDLVLVKGSRGVRTDEVVQRITEACS
ncbi:MAG: UDP-N-acetylmuramoyl-tripeptide--D-alanyl-D-alanine ligase [Acidobacteriota bacterium]